MATLEGQSSITARNDEGALLPVCDVESAMDSGIRQSVLFRKDSMSHDCEFSPVDAAKMATRNAPSVYKAEFLARVTAARSSLGFTQEEIATLLGMEQNKYAKYEKRSFLPHHLIEAFCIATRVSTEWLVTGRGRGPAISHVQQPAPPQRGRRKRSRAA